MTENEAKTKWCPMTRYRTINNDPVALQAGHNEPTGLSNLPTGGGYCIGSACMMWIATDNEHKPVPMGESSKSYPAGDCGLKSRAMIL